jgi:hypothetical protein
MVVPSENLGPVLFTSTGKGYEYYAFMCKQGGNAGEFEIMCKGSTIAQKAIEIVKMAAKEGRMKDALQSEVASLILKAISMYVHS